MRVCDIKDCNQVVHSTLMDKKSFEEFDLCKKHREINFVDFINSKEGSKNNGNKRPKPRKR